MFHISDIKKYMNCHQLYYLEKDNHGSFFNYLKNDYSLSDLIIKFFNLDNVFIGSVGDSSDLAIQNLDKYTSFYNARFEYKEMRIKPFLLIKNVQDYDLYFFHTFPQKELDLNTYYINYDVLKNNGIYVSSIKDIYVNNKYILNDELDISKIFIVNDEFKGSKIIDFVKDYQFDYLSIINDIENNTIDESSSISLKKECFTCNYLNHCFKDKIPSDSILHLVSSSYKFDMYQDGAIHLKDFDINHLEGTSLQYAQIMASRNNGLFVDKHLLKEFLSQMDSRPICFIDFEWDTYLFPIYKNMKCFGSLPFEFCLYILDENNNLINKSFVGKGDCREEFIKELLNSIPNNGPIVAFNSFSAEVLRINELIEQFPSYKDKLMPLAKRFIDLAEPFSKGMVYDLRFAGKLSVKNLVSIINGVDYHELDVTDGLDAVRNYRIYLSNNDENIKNNLIEYCNLDAYSLFIIYNYLKSLL